MFRLVTSPQEINDNKKMMQFNVSLSDKTEKNMKLYLYHVTCLVQLPVIFILPVYASSRIQNKSLEEINTLGTWVHADNTVEGTGNPVTKFLLIPVLVVKLFFIAAWHGSLKL